MNGSGNTGRTRACHRRAGSNLDTLLLYTGQRRGDVIRMWAQHVRGGTLYVKQEKTGAELAIPMHPDLAAVLPQRRAII